MKNIFLVFVFGSFLFTLQLRSSPDTLKKSEEIVQETTNTDTSLSEEPTKIEIVNIPQDSWWDIYSPYISVLFGILIGWLLSHFSQKILINKQLNFTRKENWVREFIDVSSEFVGTEYNYRNLVLNVLKDIKSQKGVDDTFLQEKYLPNVTILIKDSTKLGSYLNENDVDEKPIVDLLTEYGKIINKVIEDNSDINSIESDLKDVMKKVVDQIDKLIAKRRNELATL